MAHIVVCESNESGMECMKRAMELGHRITFIRGTTMQFYLNNDLSRFVLNRIHRLINLKVTTNPDTLLEAFQSIMVEESIDAVIAPFERSIEAVATACYKMNLPFTNTEGVLNARDKVQARKRIAEAGLLSIRFKRVHSVDAALVAGKQIGYPVIMKPVSGFDSWMARRVDSPGEAKIAAQKILDGAKTVPESVKEQYDRGILVEEYIPGDLLSAEIGILNGNKYRFMISGRALAKTNECVEMGSTIPTNISVDKAEQCFDYAEKVCEALGLDMGIFHIELKLTEKGPNLIEANPRLMGGVMPNIYKIATGSSIHDYLIDIHTGKEIPPPLPKAQGVTTVRKIMPMTDGVLAKNFDLSWVEADRHVRHFFKDKIKHEREVKGLEVLGRIMVWGENQDAAYEKADRMIEQMEKTIGVELYHAG